MQFFKSGEKFGKSKIWLRSKLNSVITSVRKESEKGCLVAQSCLTPCDPMGST